MAENKTVIANATGKYNKVLVVYYSRTGNTKVIAEKVAQAMNADTEQLIDKKDRSGAIGYVKAGADASRKIEADIEPTRKNPADYDLVIIGTPVWTWTMTPAIRTYINQNKNSIKNLAVFTSAGGTGPGKIVKDIEELAGKKAVASYGFWADDSKNKNEAKLDQKVKDFVAVIDN